MQHHGFEVVTPTLLRAGTEALALPLVALQETSSLKGRIVPATLKNRNERVNVGFAQLADSLARTRTWPRHPWETHRLVSMFELVPTLYLQATGRVIPKWRSFDEVRDEFQDRWWPYDVLEDVRRHWPRVRRRNLERAVTAVRNPWIAVAAWRHAPSRRPAPLDDLLTAGLLDGLLSLVATMREQAS
jgi:hypothetical protein